MIYPQSIRNKQTRIFSRIILEETREISSWARVRWERKRRSNGWKLGKASRWCLEGNSLSQRSRRKSRRVPGPVCIAGGRKPGEVLIPRENQDIRVACQPRKSKLLVNESNIVQRTIYCGNEWNSWCGFTAAKNLLWWGERDVTTRGRIVDDSIHSLCAIKAELCLNDL